MFGEDFLDVPVVQVSIDSSLSPEKNWAVGKAVEALRSVSATDGPFEISPTYCDRA